MSEIAATREVTTSRWLDAPAPRDGKSYWLAFDPEDWMTCEGRWQGGAWVVCATFYNPSRDNGMMFREHRMNKEPTMWMHLPAKPEPSHSEIAKS